jgi:hypothetical protein
MNLDEITSSDIRPASEVSRLTGVFFEPSKAFADIVARPRWFAPLLLIILFAFGVSIAYSQKGVWAAFSQQQAAQAPDFQKAPPEQQQARLEMSAKIGTVIGYVFPIFIPVGLLIVALVEWGIVSGILSVKIRFGQMWAIVCYAGLPGLIRSILAVVVAQIKNAADINVQNPLMFNPAAYMDPQTSSKFLYTLLSFIDLFNIWVALLIAVGIKAAAGKKFSFGSAFFAVFGPWSLWILVSSALAGLRG